jgi:hypothetical protein
MNNSPSQINDSHYFMCTITERNNGCDYDINFLMTIPAKDSPDDRLQQIALTFRGDEGDLSEDGYRVDNGDGTMVASWGHKPISPLEFSVMKKYLSVL